MKKIPYLKDAIKFLFILIAAAFTVFAMIVFMWMCYDAGFKM